MIRFDFFLCIVCALGALSPPTAQCASPASSAGSGNTGNILGNGGSVAGGSGGGTGGGNGGGNNPRKREEYLTEIEYILPSTNVSTLMTSAHRMIASGGIATAISNSILKHTYGTGRDCGIPQRVDDAMVYK